MPSTVDRKALFVEKLADATNEKNLVVLIIPTVAAPLYRLELRKLLLPIPQNMGLDLAKFTDLTNGEVTL